MRILIVDDDRVLAQLMARALGGEADVELAHTAVDALEALRRRGADLLLLDLELVASGGAVHRDGDRAEGFVILDALREEDPLCPVLVLSASADTQTRIACLDRGADDCLGKPFSLSEVRARVRALLRRRSHLRAAMVATGARLVREASRLAAGGLILDRLGRSVEMAGVPITVTASEFALLEQLLLAGGATVPRAVLRAALGGTAGEANTVDVHMVGLRRKLAVSMAAPRIETVRGTGYRLIAADPVAALSETLSLPVPAPRSGSIHAESGPWKLQK